MIVIFGSNGQLGQSIRSEMGEAPEHVFLHRESQDYCGDLSNHAGLTETLELLRPDVIINAAAYTAVDRAESEPDEARLINAKAPAIIAAHAARLNALLIHYSTDYVFDGKKTSGYLETDDCMPMSVYGKSKREGELAILNSGCRHYILRTSWVYSPYGQNFLTTMLRLMRTRPELTVVDDQHGSPTPTELLADVTLDLIHQATPGFLDQREPAHWGVYHCAAAGSTSWYDYAHLIYKTAKAHGLELTCQKISPIASKDYPAAAARPMNSRLNTDKLQKVLGRPLPDWQEGVITAVGHALLDDMGQ